MEAAIMYRVAFRKDRLEGSKEGTITGIWILLEPVGSIAGTSESGHYAEIWDLIAMLERVTCLTTAEGETIKQGLGQSDEYQREMELTLSQVKQLANMTT